MRYIEVCLDTPAELIDQRCEALAALGAEGFVIENEEERRKKEEAFEKSLQKVAEQERIRQHNRLMIIPKFILWFVIIYGLIFLFEWIQLNK